MSSDLAYEEKKCLVKSGKVIKVKRNELEAKRNELEAKRNELEVKRNEDDDTGSTTDGGPVD